MAKFDIKTVKPKFVVTTAPETKIDVSINRPIITAKNQKAYFKLKNTGGPKGEKGDTGTAATITVGSTSTGAPGTSASVTNTGSASAAVLDFVIPKGDKGDTGDTGATGSPGEAATVTVGTTTTGNPGTNASVTNSGTQSAAVLNFTIPRGAKGDAGDSATITVGTTTTGQPGTNASVTNSGTQSAAVLNFTIPRGDKGDQGDPGTPGTPGAAATIAVGTTTTGNPGTNASVTNSGTSSAAVFNFTIPKGAKGDPGDPGTPGTAATIAVGSTQTGNPGTSASVVNSGTSSAAVLDFTIPRGAKGDQGNPGSAATIAVGTVTTGLPGTSATVTNVGTSSAAVFDFTIPRGDKGEAGSGSGDMLAADYDPNGTVASAGGIVDYVASEIPPLYTELGENTDGPITQKASREALYVDSGKTVVKLGAKAFSTDTYGTRSTSVGAGTRAGGDNSVAVGDSSSAMGSYTIAVGSGATTGAGTNSISIGHNAKTNSGTIYSNSVALGASATATRDYEVNVGTGTAAGFGGNNDHTRVIAGVHAGVLNTDAVNVAQLNAALPTKTSDLTNDGADGTSAYVEADDLATVATSGSYNDLTDKPSIMSGLVEMSYGEANAWAKFIAAYQAGQIVYCRASSSADPGSGSQTRKAFMAYVNNAASPTQVEFQYYRSVSSHTDAQQGDQVFVYLLTSANGGTWSVTTRNAFSKVVAGTNMTSSYSNGTITLNATQPTVPTKTSSLTNDGADGTSTYVEADELATVATTGAYGDLTGTPTIPTVNDATLTIKQNNTTLGTFTANASTGTTVTISTPTRTTIYSNSSGTNANFSTTSAMSNYDDVEITFRDGNSNYATRTVPGNSGSFVLDISHPGGSSTVYWYISRFIVGGTNITVGANNVRKAISTTVSSTNSQDIYITKMVGIKY